MLTKRVVHRRARRRRPRTTRAPSRGTSGTPSSRSTAGSACPPRARERERFVAPRIPVDRVVRVLPQVRARGAGETIRHAPSSARRRATVRRIASSSRQADLLERDALEVGAALQEPASGGSCARGRCPSSAACGPALNVRGGTTARRARPRRFGEQQRRQRRLFRERRRRRPHAHRRGVRARATATARARRAESPRATRVT